MLPLLIKSQDVNVSGTFPQAYEKISLNIPNELTGSEVNVNNMGDEPHCASLALQRFKMVMIQAAKERAMAKAWDRTMKLAKFLPLGELASHGIDIADLIEKAYTSPDAESFKGEVTKAIKGKLQDYGVGKGREWTKSEESALLDGSVEASKQLYEYLTSEVEQEKIDGQFDNPPCGKASLVLNITAPDQLPQPPAGKGAIQMNVYKMHFDATGDCKCQYKDGDPVKLQNWHVWGDMDITITDIKVSKKAVTVTFSYGTPVYYVLAQCKCGMPVTDGGGYVAPNPPSAAGGTPVYEKICEQFCSEQYQAMVNAGTALFNLKATAKDLQPQIDKLDRQIKSLNESIADWQSKLDKLNGGINEYQTQLDNLNAKIAKSNSKQTKQALQGQATGVSGKIDDSNKRKKELQDKIDNANKQVKAKQAERAALAAKLAALNQEIGKAQKIYDDAQAAYDDCLKNCYKKAASSGNPADQPTINGNETSRERKAKESIQIGVSGDVSYVPYYFHDQPPGTAKTTYNGPGIDVAADVNYNITGQWGVGGQVRALDFGQTGHSSTTSSNTFGAQTTTTSHSAERLYLMGLDAIVRYTCYKTLMINFGPAVTFNLLTQFNSYGTTSQTIAGNTTTNSFGNKTFSTLNGEKRYVQAGFNVGAGYSIDVHGLLVQPFINTRLPFNNAMDVAQTKNYLFNAALGVRIVVWTK